MLAIDLLPAWIAGIIIAALMAAMMSTADSQLLVVSSAVVQDIYHKTLRREPKPKTLVLLSRAVTLAVGLVALAVALRQDPRNPAGVIFWLVVGIRTGAGAVALLEANHQGRRNIGYDRRHCRFLHLDRRTCAEELPVCDCPGGRRKPVGHGSGEPFHQAACRDPRSGHG